MHIPSPTHHTGRSGLSVLLGSKKQQGRLLELPLEQVVRNDAQPRTQFSSDAIAALAESIDTSGVIQPIAVRELPDGRFEIVAGERRWLASQQAGRATIPAVVHQVDARESLVLALAENLVREDLNPLETARAYAALLDEFDMSVADLARAVGKSRPAVANTLRLLELPDDVLEMIETTQLTEGHGRALLQVPDRAAQLRLARHARDEGLSVRATEELARQDSATLSAPARTQRTKWNKETPANVQDCADRIAALLGARVKVKVGERGGKVELHCGGENALLELLQRVENALA